MTALPPSGWYPDPEAGGRAWRWWDGSQWAPQQPQIPYGYGPPQTYGVAPEFLAAKFRAGTTKFGTWLRWAMVANAAWFVLASIAMAVVFQGKGLHFVNDDPYGDPQFSGGFVAVQLASIPLSLVSYAYLGTFIAWILQAGKFAEARGWPAARGRTLGAFSPLIPIVQFWWPYEAVRDSYPPGSCPSLVLKWWVSYLVAPIVGLPVFVLAIFGSALAVSVAIVVAAFVLSVPVWLGWKVIRDVEAMQRAASPISSGVN